PNAHPSLTRCLFYCLLAPPPLHSFPTRRSSDLTRRAAPPAQPDQLLWHVPDDLDAVVLRHRTKPADTLPKPGPAGIPVQRLVGRSEEHTSELQSRENLVCRLLLEKKKIYKLTIN